MLSIVSTNNSTFWVMRAGFRLEDLHKKTEAEMSPRKGRAAFISSALNSSMNLLTFSLAPIILMALRESRRRLVAARRLCISTSQTCC